MAKSAIPPQFLGAFKRGHRLNSKEFIDEELSYRLLEQALQGNKEAEATLLWIAQFNNEFHKDWFKKDLKPLHATSDLKQDCGDRNGARRKDVYTAGDRVSISPDSFDDREPAEIKFLFTRKPKKVTP